MIYCIEIKREFEGKTVEHKEFATPPTDKEVREYIETLDLGFQDGYDEFKFYEVKV